MNEQGNVVAVHAPNKHHPQFIDAGMVDVVFREFAAAQAPD
jgi:ribosomal protein S19